MPLIDVTLWGDAPDNPLGFPAEWPGPCVEVEDEFVPVVPPASRMTQAELEDYKAEHQAAFDAWQAARDAEAIPPIPTMRERIESLEATVSAQSETIAALQATIEALQAP